MNPLARSRRTTLILGAMVVLQLVWVVLIGVTSSAERGEKIPFLLVYSLLVSAFIVFLPAALAERLKPLGARFIRDPRIYLVLLCFTALVIGLVYARYQSIWEFDEEQSLVGARTIATEGLGIFFRRYRYIDWLGPQHPPLQILMYGGIMSVFGTDYFAPRLIPLIMLLGTLCMTWILGKDLYSRAIGVIASALLFAFPLMMRQGTAAMLDVPVTFYAVIAIWLVVRLRHQANVWLAIALGIVLALGLLTKYMVLFLVAAIFVIVVLLKPYRTAWRYFVLALVVMGLIFVVWLFAAAQIGVLDSQFGRILRYSGISPGNSDIGAVGGGGTSSFIERFVGTLMYKFVESTYPSLLLETLTTRLPSAIGPYTIPLLVLGTLAALKRRAEADLLLLIWIVVVSVGVILSVPDHRYFIITFPALAILMARGVGNDADLAVRAVPLAFLFNLGALYLFIDWERTARLF